MWSRRTLLRFVHVPTNALGHTELGSQALALFSPPNFNHNRKSLYQILRERQRIPVVLQWSKRWIRTGKSLVQF